MTVEPGFGGQAFMPEMLAKVEKAAELRQSRGWSFRIEVDGGINGETAPRAIQSGADTLVAGTSFFHAPDAEAAVRQMRGEAAS